MDLERVCLDSIKKQFMHYKKLGEQAMAQVEEERLFHAPNEDTNSIAVVVKHLRGNMLSRWTDFRTTDGEKSWRDRDGEFVNDIAGRDELLALWNEGWDCLFAAIDSIGPGELTDVIHIRNEAHTIMDALNRQLAHYPYHVGQIVYAAKQLKDGAWSSLSIPRNRSAEYSGIRFGQSPGLAADEPGR